MKKLVFSIVISILVFMSVSTTSMAAGKKSVLPRPELDYTERSPYHGMLLDSLRDDTSEKVTVVYDDYGNVISLEYLDVVNQNNNY